MANPITDAIKIGTIGELLVQLRLLEYGIQASPPIKDSGNDLLAVKGRQFRFVQVKTTTKSKFPNLPNNKKLYDLLAIVDLCEYNTKLKLDKSIIYLIKRDDLSKIKHNIAKLKNYKIDKVANEYFTA